MAYTGQAIREDQSPDASSNLPAIINGIATTLATATGIDNVITTLPKVPSNDPLLYIVKPRWSLLRPAYGEQAIRWVFEGVLALPTENNEQVESDMVAAIINLIEVAGHDLDADESFPDGQFLIEGGTTDYGAINGIPVLAHKFELVVDERVPYTHTL